MQGDNLPGGTVIDWYEVHKGGIEYNRAAIEQT